MQEPVFVLHLITCHGRIMPRLAELLLFVAVLYDLARLTYGYIFERECVMYQNRSLRPTCSPLA